MRRVYALVTATLSCLTVLSLAKFVCGDFPAMMMRVPGDANVLMVMDLERILASPLATKEGWKDKRASNYAARPLTFPPQVTRLVRGAHVDLELHEAKWQVDPKR